MMSQQSSNQNNILLIALPHLVEKGDAKDSKIRSFMAFPYGLLSIATYLKKHSSGKINIEIIDCNLYKHEKYIELINNNMRKYSTDVVGISMVFDNSYPYLKDIAKTIKDTNKKTVVVLGGTSVSLCSEEVLLAEENIDGVCYSEGEIPFERLIHSENMIDFLESDPSWITRKSLKTGKRNHAFIDDLDEVIDIDYSIVDINKYKMKEAFSPFVEKTTEDKKQFFLVTTRGCPYRCVFCANFSMHGKKIRCASVDKIIKHVKLLVDEYGMKVLTIYDDQFLAKRERAKEILRQLAQFHLRIECPNGLSVSCIDDEMAGLLKKAGVDTVALAIESGSEYMIKHIIHKPLKLGEVKQIVKYLREHGLFIEGFFVIGIPGEKEEHRNETVSFIKDVELDWSGFSLAAPLKGSPLYDICIENGYINKNLKIGQILADKYIIKTPELDPEQITKKTYLMNLDVNFVNNYRMKVGDYRVAVNCFRDVISRYDNHAFAHYYLAKALEKLNAAPEEINLNRNKFTEIVNKASEWKEYADYFKLTVT